MDITIIQIFKNEIEEKFFLLPYLGDRALLNKNIYLLHYPGGHLSYSEGSITNIDNYQIEHNAETKKGLSGCPIILKDTYEIIGIHKQKNANAIKKEENYGSLINPTLPLNIESNNYDFLAKFLYNNYRINRIYRNKNLFYKGQILDQQEYGKGIIIYQNNKNDFCLYAGDFVKGKFEGNGRYFYENGDRYDGQWKNGIKHGIETIYYKNGTIKYEGNFVNDKPDGYGKIFFENNEYYEGQRRRGFSQGKGKEYYYNGKVKYEGDFYNDKFGGRGKFIYKNCEYYIGQWKDGKRNGEGKLYYSDGKIKYDGDFVNDKKEGYGKYFYRFGKYYDGEWEVGNNYRKVTFNYHDEKIKYNGNSYIYFKKAIDILFNENYKYYEGKWNSDKKKVKG